MATNFKTIWNGVKLKAKSILTSDTKGEMEVDETSGKLQYHNGTSRSPVVTEAHTATVTNKTIDADNNAISNLEVDNLKAGVLNTSTTIAGATDAQIPSALAVKTYVDDKTAAQNEASEIIVSPAINGNTNAQAVMEDHESRIISAVSDIATNATNISDHINDTLGAHLASAIGTTPSGNLSATDVQTALNELQSDIDTRATITSLNNHLTDTVDAHDASAISVVPTGNLAASDAQTAFNELQTNIDSLYNDTNVVANDLNNHIIDIDDAHDASAISNIPSGNLAATNVQAALNELQTDVDTRATSSALSTHASTASGVHGVVGTIVGTSDSQTLTNKTIDADLNTLSNIDNADIKAAAAIARTKLASGTASKVLVNDGSGVMSEMANVTDSTNALILSNLKHIELQSIDDSTSTGSDATIATFSGGSVRLTNVSLTSIANIPAGSNGQQVVIFNRTGNTVTIKDSSAALGSASARIYTGTNANITLVDKAALILSYDSVSSRWQVIGGSGGGASALSALSDVTISSPANNQVLTYDSATGKWVNRASQSSASVDTLTQQLFDNAVLGDFTQTGLTLSTSNPIKGTVSALLTHQPATSQSFKQTIAVDRKFRGYNTTLSLVVRSSAASANLTILVTDETNSATLLSSSQITTGQQVFTASITNASANITVSDNTQYNALSIGDTVTGTGIPANTVIIAKPSANVATLSQNATATNASASLKASDLPRTQRFSFAIPANCASLSYTVTALQEAGSPESYIDDVQIYLAQTTNSSYSLTQTTFNATDWAPYTPTFTGFGTPTAVEFEWRQVGANYEIRGKFTSGVSTATEARISLPNGAVSAGTSIIPSIQYVGSGVKSTSTASMFTVLIEPSVSYVTIGLQNVGSAGLTKQNGSSLITSPDALAIFASVPIAGLTANTTTTNTIPLTSSVLVTQPDSYLRITGFSASANGSTATKIASLTSGTIQQNIGNAIQYLDDSVNGARFVAQQEGLFRFEYSGDTNTTTSNGTGFSLNTSSFTTDYTSLPASEKIAAAYEGGAGTIITVFGEVYLRVGDVVRIHRDATQANTQTSLSTFTASYIGSTKILNPSSDQKIQIPTHQLRFEGCSGIGSTASAIAKFDTQTIVKGDAWTVVSDAANGTVITMKKAGILSVDASIFLSANGDLNITKNQTTLTTLPTNTSEVICAASVGDGTIAATTSASGKIEVNVGDVIRVSCNGVSGASTSSHFNLHLQETSVAVALQNVTPTYDNSDSAIRLDTANGWGSVSTRIRRFSNTIQNFGTDVTYTDSATLGSSFTINKDGEYMITYTEEFSAADYMGISLNSASLATSIQSITTSEVLAMTVTAAANNPNTVSWQGYLVKGDVVRPHTSSSGTGTTPARTKFTIARVGKTSGTVDVTPFVQIPTQDVEAIEALTATSTWGSTNTGVPVLNITKNTNLGIIQVISDSVNGTSFKALKDCEIKLSTTMWGSASAGSYYLTKNATILTATSPDGVVNYATTAGNGFGTPSSINLKLVVGDVIRVQRSSTVMTNTGATTLTATAISSSIATSTQQVSSDTMSFVFKSTAIDPNTDAIGTFNTYTYAANTLTATLATTAPTQTTSSMNTNGILITGRGYGTNSAAATPSRFDIFIGKGLKSKQVDAFLATGKVSPAAYDYKQGNASSNYAGTSVYYSELTGILTLASEPPYASITSMTPAVDVNGAGGNAYFVFNASKSPSLVTVPQLQPRIALVETNGGGSRQAITSVAATVTFNSVTDATGILSTNANQITLQPGTYFFDGHAMIYNAGSTTNAPSRIFLYNVTTSSIVSNGTIFELNSTAVNYGLSSFRAYVTITSTSIFEIRSQSSTNNGYYIGDTVTSPYDKHMSIAITKIK